jgi:hypothetical protein
VKDLIRKILKEDKTDRFIHYVVNNMHKFKHYGAKNEIINRFGLTEDMILKIKNDGFSKISRLIGVPLDTSDYPDLYFGSYSFRFKLLTWSYFDQYDELVVDVEFLNEGNVEVDGEDYTLKDAVNDEDWGWEVGYEIEGAIIDILRNIIPELIIIEEFSVAERILYEG